MGWDNKIIWSEGMFLRPQHFQQHDRYLESLIEGRCAPLHPHPWGMLELELDQELLSLGKFSVATARGILPDGTPFAIPSRDEAPTPLEIPPNLHDAGVYLGIPLRQAGVIEADGSGAVNQARYSLYEYEARDSNAGADISAQVQIGKLRLRLLLESDQRNGYACLKLAHITESRTDKKIILNENFIPPALHCGASPKLTGHLRELLGLLHYRGEALAARVSESGRGGAAEIADFLLLQAVNRYEPLFAHLVPTAELHPEEFYRLAVMLAGELATFTRKQKRPASFPPYRHDDLFGCFEAVMREIRQSLSMVLEQNAIPMVLQDRKYGIRVAPITDRNLLSSASFVLAVNAEIPAEVLRSRFPAQVKIGPVEQIRQLVNLQLPGIGLRPLPVAPRQIPFHAGFTYFELDRTSEYWKQLENSGGFALHIAGDFPGIELEFWAIKG